jgi:hypothetical protein
MSNIFSLFSKRTPRQPFTKTLTLEPEFALPLETFTNRSGEFLVYFDLTEFSSLSALVIDLFIKPAPKAQFVLYQHVKIERHPDQAPLWSINLPYCCGMMITAKQLSFKTLHLPIYIWET